MDRSNGASSSFIDVLNLACTIPASMQDVLDCDGPPMLHRSRWRCLASTYSAEMADLVALARTWHEVMEDTELDGHLQAFSEDIMWKIKVDGPLQALLQALQEGEACMRAYFPPEGNHHSWLVDKALKLAMSTDVVDVHLHDFLWASSVVREHIFRITGFEGKEAHLLEQTRKLHEIWVKEDAEEDLRTAQSFLTMLQHQYSHNHETWQLADFILHKLSHIHNQVNHVAPGSLPPYMCIHSDQCLPTNTDPLFSTDVTEVREVLWLGGRFVLKCFKYLMDEEFTNSEAAFNDFREAEIQARVWHPHVVPLVCRTNNPPGLLMELLQENLHALIKRRRKHSENDSPFPLFMAVDLMLQIAKGLEYLHSDTLRIIHRDLKPANILVSFPLNSGIGDSNHDVIPQVRLKIADFGVSKAKDDCWVYTTRDQGTVAWMAPEVYGEDGGKEVPEYSNKADVYSFGIVCSEILTGEVPFKGLRSYIVRARVLKGERPALPQNCPPALSSFIQMCWHADPTKRPTFIQICRMLRYFKACILLADWHEYEGGLLRCRISPDMCAHIDDMMAHSLTGRTFQPKALGIPLEMYSCGVQLQKFGFPPDLQGWDSQKHEVWKVALWRRATRAHQQMCEDPRWGEQVKLPAPHCFKELRRFTFEELSSNATAKFATLMPNPVMVGYLTGELKPRTLKSVLGELEPRMLDSVLIRVLLNILEPRWLKFGVISSFLRRRAKNAAMLEGARGGGGASGGHGISDFEVGDGKVVSNRIRE